MSQITDFFEGMADRVDKTKIVGMSVIYQFMIEGDGGGEWNIALRNGEAVTTTGCAESPNITLTMTAENFIKLLAGELNGQTAFLTGRLKIKGDMGLALKLQSIFQLG